MSRGGKREGSGRKAQNKKALSCKLPADVIEFLNRQDETKTSTVEKAIRMLMRLENNED